MGVPEDDRQTIRAFQLLQTRGYIDSQSAWGEAVPWLIRATEKGLQQTSGWPAPERSSDVGALISVLDERIQDRHTSDEDRTRLQRWRAAVAELGKGIVSEVLASYAAKMSSGG